MAYTGTGTEQDPYLVDTLTDLVALATSTSIYIKIIADIDASQEDTYKEPVTSSFDFRGQIYADEMKKISNVVVENQNMISTSSYSTVENIFFENWIHRKTSSSPTIYAQYPTFKNCCFSIEMVDDVFGSCLLGKNSSYGSNGSFLNCAFYVKFTSGAVGTATSDNLFKYVNINKCTFMFENLKRSNLSLAGAETKITNCTFLGDAELLPSSTTVTLTPFANDSVYTKSKIIFALNLTLSDEAEEGTTVTLSFGNYVTYVMMDAEILGSEFTTSFSSPTCRALTTEQIKSEQYLEDIGFLP